VEVTARSPGAAWQRASVASGFLDERRDLIPLWDVQEDLARRLLTRDGRRVRRFCDLGAGGGGFAELLMDAHDDDILASAEEQCAWLEEIGFEQVDIYFKLPELAIFGGAKGG
jgi:hypothetical protein